MQQYTLLKPLLGQHCVSLLFMFMHFLLSFTQILYTHQTSEPRMVWFPIKALYHIIMYHNRVPERGKQITEFISRET